MLKSKPKSQATRPLRVKQEKRTEAAPVPAAEPPRSKMETLALEYDLLCLTEEELRKRDGKPGRHFINTIDRRLPAIEGLLETSVPENFNDLFIFAIMMRSKLATLRDCAGCLIRPEEYGDGERAFTAEDYQKIAPGVRSEIEDLQAMISLMIDGMEHVTGTTAKRLGIGRIAAANDFSE